ncbi:MAG: YggS family pyridoxal phosphate-dependent enzyme [Cyanothece sp. SIO2G6]|nr:YggS family pyridoxal phosphate-dependent enzyme [Cyanothece sp. SIO2G6]
MLHDVAQRLNAVCPLIPEQVTMIAVTKKKPVEAIRAAYALGIRHFGESRVQEAIAKQAELTDLPDITWHLIGHLQSNKAAKAIEHFDWIHSLDSLKLAQRLNQILQERDGAAPHGKKYRQPRFCLQVKMVPDPNKSGWTQAELWQDLAPLSQLSHLSIAGLMTIPPLGQNDDEIYDIFSQAKAFADQIQHRNVPNITMEQLSMGMSGDYPLAIKAGSTMVRLGRTLFGDR